MLFKIKVTEMIAYRATYICSNLECNTSAIGPALTDSALEDRKEEAVHIIGEKLGATRFTSNPDINANSAENEFWLCANCHTLIGKNDGADYTGSELFERKEEHEDPISVLLRTHESPLPLVSRQPASHEIVQNIIDYISSKGVYFQHLSVEDPIFTINSIGQVRKIIQREMKNIDTGKHLKGICRGIQDASRELVSELSLDSSMLDARLSILRKKTDRQLKGLRDKAGCDTIGQITTIIP